MDGYSRQKYGNFTGEKLDPSPFEPQNDGIYWDLM